MFGRLALFYHFNILTYVTFLMFHILTYWSISSVNMLVFKPFQFRVHEDFIMVIICWTFRTLDQERLQQKPFAQGGIGFQFAVIVLSYTFSRGPKIGFLEICSLRFP